jgi:hypothetical protein
LLESDFKVRRSEWCIHPAQLARPGEFTVNINHVTQSAPGSRRGAS